MLLRTQHVAFPKRIESWGTTESSAAQHWYSGTEKCDTNGGWQALALLSERGVENEHNQFAFTEMQFRLNMLYS